MDDRILCITDPTWYGVKRTLAGIGKWYATPDLEDVLRMVESVEPKVVVFGCYRPEWEKILKAVYLRGIKTVLAWYAPYTLNEFDATNRTWMVAALKQAKQGLFDFVVTSHGGLADSWRRLGLVTRARFLPVFLETLPALRTPIDTGTDIHIGIFGSAMPWKNQETQIVGAMMASPPKVVIHVQNAPRDLLETLEIYVHRHRHVPSDQAFLDLVASMKINMCVSMVETFSILSAESMALGVPVVASSTVPIFRMDYEMLPRVQEACRVLNCHSVVDQPDDPRRIAMAITSTLLNYVDCREAGRILIEAVNDRNKAEARRVIETWFE